MIYLFPLFAGFILDLIFGDPQGFPHPVRLIGKTINFLERLLRKSFSKSPKGEFWAGVSLSLIVIIFSFALPFLVLLIAYKINISLALAIHAIMCYQILAIKSLRKESMKVYRELDNNDVEMAREKVAMIVGRDTENLNEEEIAKATVETIAENASDGIIAPMLFIAIGGAPLGFLYKAINTMDSMIGYKNDKYIHFGRFAAKLDDIVNYIPARFSALIMIVASFLSRMNYKDAWRIFKRDRFNHASPNSAQTESVCSGALGIQLSGDAYYFGEKYEKPTIGDINRPVNIMDIVLANRLILVSSCFSVIVALGVQLLIVEVFKMGELL